MTGLAWPNGSTRIPRVTSEFGYRRHPITRLRRLHKGIDLAGFELVRSPVAGEVVKSSYQPLGAGHYVDVRSKSGDLYRYFHLKAGTKLPRGAQVRPGTVLGVMGKSGAVTGVHLHFEVWPGGQAPINPRTFYARHQTPAKPATPPPPATIPVPEEDEIMSYKRTGQYAETDGGKTVHYQVTVLELGIVLDFSNGTGAGPYTTEHLKRLATSYGLEGGGFFLTTPGQLEVNRKACEKRAAAIAAGARL